MKVRLKDSYNGPIPKDVLYDAIRVKDGYCIGDNQGRAWSIHKDSVEEVDEFEEEFNRLCKTYDNGDIEFNYDRVVYESKMNSGSIYLRYGLSSIVLGNREVIPALILALLKLMDE